MKYRNILAVIFLLPLLAACGARSGAPVCEYSPEPMYGTEEGTSRSTACKEADEAFLAEMDQTGYSRSESAERIALVGFDYLEKGDLRTAMERFNQSWLLNERECLAFSGFAAVKLLRDGEAGASERYFQRALALCPGRPEIKADFGMLMERMDRCEEGISYLEQSLLIDPSDTDAWKALVRCHVRISTPETTLAVIERAQENGAGVDRTLIEELRRRARQNR